MLNGLHAVMIKYREMSKKILTFYLAEVRRESAGGSPAMNFTELIKLDHVDNFRILGNSFLLRGMAQATDIHFGLAMREENSYLMSKTFVQAAMIVAFLLVYTTHYRIQIKRYDSDIKGMRSWLTLLPSQVVTTVPWLFETAQKLIRRGKRRRP